jgi:hypothetical protein
MVLQKPLIIYMMKNKVKNDNEYGNSRFNNENEIKMIFKEENIYLNKKTGFDYNIFKFHTK